MTHLAVIQHSEAEWLGHLEDHFEGRGIRFGYHRPFVAGGRLPELATLGDGLVLVGSGDYGAASRPPAWFDAEVRLVRACLMLERPVLAMGLGAQVLAIAADGGAQARPLALTVTEARRASSSALDGLIPDVFPMIAYGRDEPAPPAYAERLAIDPDGRCVAFAIGAKAFGFSGHLGVRRAMIEDLVMASPETACGVPERLDEVGALARRVEDALLPLVTGLVHACRWF